MLSLRFLDLQVVILEPFESIARIIVIDHPTNFCRIVPKIAKTTRMIIRLIVVQMGAISQPSCQQSETFADISRVRVDENI
jgi:hypothetical protein